MADLARHHDIRQEIHLYGLVAVAAASLATSALDIERETSGLVASYLSLRQGDKEISDVREHSGVCGGIASWSASQRTLVYIHHLVDILNTLYAGVGHGGFQRTVEVLAQNGL